MEMDPSSKANKSPAASHPEGTKREAIPQVIVDVDPGTDDSMALLLLIAAQRRGEVDILGITCVHGNSTVKNVSKNVARILEAVECCDIPVFLGSEKPLIPISYPPTVTCPQFFGADGFGDLNFPEVKNLKVIQEENAIEALNRLTVSANSKGKVTLICLGPLTNIALAMRTYSDFADNLQGLYIMGGNSTGMGNITSAAEFNFYNDPEAAHIVLSSASCPITLLPWETSLNTEIPLDWRFNVLGKVNVKAIEMLNAVEKKVYDASPFTAWYPCDAVVVAMFLWPEIILKQRECHMSVELNGSHTRGQVVVDHLQNNTNNVILIEQVNIVLLQKKLFSSVEQYVKKTTNNN